MKNLGINELKILSVLLLGEQYGLEIIKTLQKETGAVISLGGLYTTTKRLEEKGFLKSRWEDAASDRSGNRRKYYRITAPGRAVLLQAKKSLSILLKHRFTSK